MLNIYPITYTIPDAFVISFVNLSFWPAFIWHNLTHFFERRSNLKTKWLMKNCHFGLASFHLPLFIRRQSDEFFSENFSSKKFLSNESKSTYQIWFYKDLMSCAVLVKVSNFKMSFECHRLDQNTNNFFNDFCPSL